MKTSTLGSVWLLVLALAACGAADAHGPGSSADPLDQGAAGAAPSISADEDLEPVSPPAAPAAPAAPAPPAPFGDVLAYDWQVEPGVEQYYCVYQTLSEDLWVSEFRPLSPAGTHHVTLGFQAPAPPDGVLEAGDPDAPVLCDGTTLGDVLSYSAAVGTQGLTLPDGIATKIPAGKQLVLSIHVFNATDAPLRGRSGIEVVRRDPASVMHEAEQIAALDPVLQVPPGRSTQTTTCTMEADTTIVAALGHMHQRGVRMTTTAIPVGGEPIPVLDVDYDFGNQVYELLDEPVQLRKGDALQVACEFDNPGDRTLVFGESTDANEMCITFFYRYPAVATSYLCTQ